MKASTGAHSPRGTAPLKCSPAPRHLTPCSFVLLHKGSLPQTLPHPLTSTRESLLHSLTRAMKPEESYGNASEDLLLLLKTSAAPCNAVVRTYSTTNHSWRQG